MRNGIKIDFSGFRDFNNALKEYRKWSKKQPAEVINSKMFFIARNATNTTKKADPNKIRDELSAPSRDYPDVELGAIIVNVQQHKKGKKGLTGEKMARALEKLKRIAVSHTNFLRSGWLPAIRILSSAVKRGDVAFTTRYAPKQAKGLKQIGKDKGSAIYAKDDSVRCHGEIANFIGQDKQSSPTVQNILLKGLQEAVTLEVKSMVTYLQKKYDEAHKRFFNKQFKPRG